MQARSIEPSRCLASFAILALLTTGVWAQPATRQTPDGEASPTIAVAATDFLNSIGVATSFPDRGQPLPRTIEMIRYAGFRWVRGGIEGVSSRGPDHRADVSRLAPADGRPGELGAGQRRHRSGEALADCAKAGHGRRPAGLRGKQRAEQLGRDLPGRKRGRPCSVVAGRGQAPARSVPGRQERSGLENSTLSGRSARRAEADNVGLQFLSIPQGAGTILPAGTRFADFANVHNYIYHPNSPRLEDNKTWNAADPTSACKIDGLYGNVGVTWAKHFRGYSERELLDTSA